MIIDLTRKTFAIFGLKGTGKSTLADYIAREYGLDCLVYDTVGEFPATSPYYVYKPKVRNDIAELEKVIVSVTQQKSLRMLIIDEANRYAPSKPKPLPPLVADLNDQARHYNISVGYIARRPTQLNQDLTELADYLFIYHLKGKSDIQYLENISEGLGQAVLDCAPYQFVVVYPDRSYTQFDPIPTTEAWTNNAIQHIES